MLYHTELVETGRTHPRMTQKFRGLLLPIGGVSRRACCYCYLRLTAIFGFKNILIYNKVFKFYEKEQVSYEANIKEFFCFRNFISFCFIGNFCILCIYFSLWSMESIYEGWNEVALGIQVCRVKDLMGPILFTK